LGFDGVIGGRGLIWRWWKSDMVVGEDSGDGPTE
jgi:hypothetical protein